MIKRIIFDVDNTLIWWKDEYSDDLKEVVDKYNYDIDYMKIDSIFDRQEKCHDKITIQNIINDTKELYDFDISEDFVKDALLNQYKLAIYDEKLIDVIKYLSTKYDLIVVSNWFKDVQENRLITAGIREYFSKIIGGDIELKPSVLSKINDDYKYEECLMVGDSDYYDINPAKKLGMQTYKINKYEDLYKLKEMF